MNETHESLRGKPLNLLIQPEQWVNDYAVDAGPTMPFDAAPILHNMTETDRERLLDESRTGSLGELGDWLYESTPEAPAWGGPYSVYADTEELERWFADNPPWTEDGKTPHPAGDYVSIQEITVTEEGKYVVFLDADGWEHRTDGPAKIHYLDGEPYAYEWYHHGKLHRTDGPAKTGTHPSEDEFWVDGKRHRTDGPARFDSTINRGEFWIEGQQVGHMTILMEPGWKLVDGAPVRDDRD